MKISDNSTFMRSLAVVVNLCLFFPTTHALLLHNYSQMNIHAIILVVILILTYLNLKYRVFDYDLVKIEKKLFLVRGSYRREVDLDSFTIKHSGFPTAVHFLVLQERKYPIRIHKSTSFLEKLSSNDEGASKIRDYIRFKMLE